MIPWKAPPSFVIKNTCESNKDMSVILINLLRENTHLRYKKNIYVFVLLIISHYINSNGIHSNLVSCWILCSHSKIDPVDVRTATFKSWDSEIPFESKVPPNIQTFLTLHCLKKVKLN